jgi:hypothetical protein
MIVIKSSGLSHRDRWSVFATAGATCGSVHVLHGQVATLRFEEAENSADRISQQEWLRLPLHVETRGVGADVTDLKCLISYVLKLIQIGRASCRERV